MLKEVEEVVKLYHYIKKYQAPLESNFWGVRFSNSEPVRRKWFSEVYFNEDDFLGMLRGVTMDEGGFYPCDIDDALRALENRWGSRHG